MCHYPTPLKNQTTHQKGNHYGSHAARLDCLRYSCGRNRSNEKSCPFRNHLRNSFGDFWSFDYLFCTKERVGDETNVSQEQIIGGISALETIVSQFLTL